MAEADNKKLVDLRVVDLKAELEKREIDTSGVKAVLVKKLHKALVDEGHDPDTYIFQIESKGTPVKQGTRKKESVSEEDQDMDKDDKSNDKEEAPSKEENDRTDDKAESNDQEVTSGEKVSPEENQETKSSPEDKKETVASSEDSKEVNEESSCEEKKEEDKPENPSETSVEKDESNENPTESKEESKEDKTEETNNKSDENVEEKSTALEETPDVKADNENKTADSAKEEEKTEDTSVKEDDRDMKDDEEEEEDPKDYEEEEVYDTEHHEDDSKAEDKNENDMNGLDNEDSINLTLGEEDEKLMAGEVDLLTKDGKDLKERGVSRLTSSKKQGSAQEQHRKSDARNASPDKAADDKAKKSNYRNLWVSGLSSITRATDLKQVFSKLGKVVAAKVVTNAKTPGARCYGFVTMATSDDAQKCIKGLNLTELHGRLISVEAVANRPHPGAKKTPLDDRKRPVDDRRRLDDKKRIDERKKVEEKKKDDIKRKIDLSPSKVDEKRRKRANSENLVPPGTEDMVDENGEAADAEKIVGGEEGSEKGGDESIRGIESDARSRSSRGKSRDRRRRSTSSRRSHQQGGVLSFSQIKEERERARARERERAAREEERRRRERHRAIERKQRDEALRLEREREKIRIERERLERERTELLRLERERLEREKEDLKRQQLKLEEARRNKRTLSSSRDGYDDRKRVATESSRRYDPVHLSPARDYKKESRRDAISPPVRGRYEEPSRTSRRDEPRVKDRVYSERGAGAGGSSASFRSRDDRDRREDGGHRMKSDSARGGTHRGDAPSAKGWGSAVGKGGFSGVTGGGSRETWNMTQDRKPEISPWARPPAQSERWASNSSMIVSGRSGGPMYPPGMTPMPSSMGMPMSSGYQQGDRFDAYKPMGSAPRKY